MSDLETQTPKLRRSAYRLPPYAILVIAACVVIAFLIFWPRVVVVNERSSDAWPMSTFHTQNLIVDTQALVGETQITSDAISGGFATNANTIFHISPVGYQGGTTRFSHTEIDDGKGTGNGHSMMYFDASQGKIKVFGDPAVIPTAQFEVAGSADFDFSVGLHGITTVNPLPGDSYPLSILAPVEQLVVVHAANNGEIFRLHVDGDGTPRVTTAGDVAGVVSGIENTLQFDTTAGANAAIALYGSSNAVRVAGAGGLTNIGVDGGATGGDFNFAFYAAPGKGVAKFSDGGDSGPWAVVGDFTQSAGNVDLNATSGTTTIRGDTHIVGHSLLVDTSFECGTNGTVDGNLRVNGFSNLDGGGGSFTYEHRVETSGVPFQVSNSIAFETPQRVSSSTTADPVIAITIVTGAATLLTLADGTKDGQIKFFVIESGTGSITPTNLIGGTVFTWSSAPAGLTLVWDATAGKWTLLSSNGMVLT